MFITLEDSISECYVSESQSSEIVQVIGLEFKNPDMPEGETNAYICLFSII